MNTSQNINLSNEPLKTRQIEELKQFDTPIVSNALELLGFRHKDRNAGIMSSQLQARFPNLPPLFSYMATRT
jgi:hypothetical protein